MTDNKKPESIKDLYGRLIKEMNESKKNNPEMWKDVDPSIFDKFETTYQRFYGSNSKQYSDCMHDNCSRCHGTGIDETTKAVCIHMISCPCERCTPRF